VASLPDGPRPGTLPLGAVSKEETVMSQADPFTPPDHPRSSAGCFVVAVTGLVVFVTMLFLGGVLATVLFPRLLPWDRHKEPQRRGIGGKLTRLELLPLTGGGDQITLDDLKGRVVLLTFWGTWSEPSREQLPRIAAVGEKFRNREGFLLLPVSCGRGVHADLRQLRLDTVAFLQEKDIRIATFADPNQVSRLAVEEVVGFADYPTTLVLDRTGAVRGVWSQEAADGELEALIGKLLEES